MPSALQRKLLVATVNGSGHQRGMLLGVAAGFNPSNINHELCHYTDDVTKMAAGFTPSNINHELCHYTDDVT
jgi:hypothetical protein